MNTIPKTTQECTAYHSNTWRFAIGQGDNPSTLPGVAVTLFQSFQLSSGVLPGTGATDRVPRLPRLAQTIRSFTVKRYFPLSHRHLAVLLLLGTLSWIGRAAEPSDERAKETAELEKKIADLKKKLEALKNEPRPLTIADIPKWRSIRQTTLSNDGQWFAYRVGPQEGEGELVIRSIQTDKEFKFPSGEGFGNQSFSHDSKWLAFSVAPGRPRGAAALAPPLPPAKAKVVLVNLANGEKLEFENIRRFAFSGETPTHIALHKSPADGAPSTPSGTDLLLHELVGGAELNLGNVAEFVFDKKGTRLALLIDAAGQAGNGVQIRDMKTGVLAPLDTAKATYASLSWSKEGDALACLKEVEAKPGEPKQTIVLGFTTPAKWEKIVYDPRNDPTFPKKMVISRSGSVAFTEDLGGIVFGIAEISKTDDAKKDAKTPAKEEPKKDERIPKKGPGSGPSNGVPGDKPDLVVWHWKDERLQSQQQVEAGADKSITYLCVYRIKEKKFVRLADEKLRRVALASKERWAVGIDDKPYRLMGTLDGKRFLDIYVIDAQSGERRLALTRNRWYFGPSPDGTHFLYYQDGHFFTYEIATGKSCNITADTSIAFVDSEDDHNIEKPPTRTLGWSKDELFVLLSDNWDIWKVPAHGGPGTNLTVNGKRDGIRYQSLYRFDPEARGYDLSKPLIVATYGEWTKKAGFSQIDPNSAAPPKVLTWNDAAFGSLQKAKDAETYAYTVENCKECPDWYISGPTFGSGKRMTNANPDQGKFFWSSGVRLIDYTSARGEKLQAALLLPAKYEPGKKYPAVVYIYEKLSQNANRYLMPNLSGFNPALYTSSGYAVLMPDIRYAINDPGKSAVGCVLPALDAAVNSGVVDAARVGLQGHSWGGYQTAFLITQTDAFKAACAGAPLTDLVSMYSSIYWNTGWTNQPIFESSQGRFTSGYWDNLDAFVRNSPVFHAKNVKTPLLLLHNDKDGAVDWNQGIEYFNTLRRLQKPVVMLQYKGENHGVVKPANRKDYTTRMKEFFDHHLMDKPAPDWLKDGVPHLKIDDHLKERGKE
jgi:dipeptidyl aminopeptidase/acylaminoacyl peptidase